MGRTADNRPPYARIAAHYRALIGSGELPPGALLPSHNELAAEWSVSRATAEKALRVLREEELARGIPGIGTEVTTRPVSLSSGSERHDRGGRTQSSWLAGEKSSGHSAAIASAPDHVAQALGIEPGDDVLRRSRVYRDSHGVVSHSTSWIPKEFARVAPELLKSERLSGGLSLNVIAQATSRSVAQRVDEEAARIATEDDLKLLELAPDTVAAILVLTARFLDADGQPLEYGVDLGAPGRTRRTTSDVPL